MSFIQIRGGKRFHKTGDCQIDLNKSWNTPNEYITIADAPSSPK